MDIDLFVRYLFVTHGNSCRIFKEEMHKEELDKRMTYVTLRMNSEYLVKGLV